jgi:hypothetical protein
MKSGSKTSGEVGGNFISAEINLEPPLCQTTAAV